MSISGAPSGALGVSKSVRGFPQSRADAHHVTSTRSETVPRDAVAAGGLSVTIVGDPADYARLIGRALEGIDLEAADEVVDRMDDPRIARRFGHLSIKTAPIVYENDALLPSAKVSDAVPTAVAGLATNGVTPNGVAVSR